MGKTLKILSLLIFLGASVVLCWPPARNLEYEYALVVSWLLAIGLPIVGCLIPQAMLPELENVSLRQFLAVLFLPLISFVPGAVLFVVQVCPCGKYGFGLWMVLLALPACLLGLAGFFWVRKVFANRVMRWLVACSPLLPAAVGLMTLWFLPQKRLINSVLGFLHGPIYDRWIALDWGVVLARSSHALAGITLMAMALGIVKLNSKRLKIALVAIIAMRVTAFFSDLGGHGVLALDRALPDKVLAPGVEVYYERQSEDDADLAKSLARDAAFHAAEIKDALSVKINDPIRIYAYRDVRRKKLLFGGGQTDITDVWTPSVHVELRASPHPTLRHELVHAVASFVSWHDLGFHPNMLITEGLAMALAPTEQSLDFDEVSAALIRSGRIESLEALFSPLGFWSESGFRSYQVAGSFMRWLQRKYGPESVRAIYRGQPIQESTGHGWNELMGQWQSDIIGRFEEKNEMIVERFSRDPGVLHDLCPHTAEDWSRPRSEGYLTRLRQPPGWDPESLNSWLLDISPDNREVRLEIFNRDIGRRMRGRDQSIQELDALIQVAQKGRIWPPKVAEDLDMLLIQSDLERIAGRKKNSVHRLHQLQSIFEQKDPGTVIKRQAEARLALEQSVKSPESMVWRKYIAGWGDMPEGPQNESWIVAYLRSRREKHATREQVKSWSAMLLLTTGFPEIKKEWLKNLAAAFVEHGDFARAAALYSELARVSTGDAKALAEQNQRRVESFLVR